MSRMRNTRRAKLNDLEVVRHIPANDRRKGTAVPIRVLGNPSPHIVSDEAWRDCLDQIKDIILRPYTGVCEIGFDPLNEISLTIAGNLNVIPGSVPHNPAFQSDNRYAGLSAHDADKLMCDRIGEMLFGEFEEIRSIPDSEWQLRDNRYWAQALAGAVWAILQSRLRGAPHG
ncbi:hypothetical protein JAU75_01560 [Ochrobactrum sp. Q0168]|uniref:hypothetical protein n=1 Tax=Ochrobactrum sp. Q0168 TaxID=2793241 RepID=UPI0018ED64B8|nr:hypothetical protein [Ochrobactrum sp. Q0168]